MRLLSISLAAYVVAVIVGFYGWAENILKIIHTMDDPVTGLFIARIAGVFLAPLGAILGLFV